MCIRSCIILAFIFNVPGISNSRILLPLLKSWSSSLTSLSLEQYLECSSSASQCSLEQCVGHPQSGHSNLTARGISLVWCCAVAQTGQGASLCIASPRARISWKGDCENDRNKSSSARTGVGSFVSDFGLKKLNRCLRFTCCLTL